MKSTQRTVIITGAASGIGLETAKFLVNQGYSVLIIDNDLQLIEDVSSQMPAKMLKKLLFLKLDLSKWEAGDLIMGYCKKNNLKAFALINNISYRSIKNLADEDLESWEKTFSLTLRSSFVISQSFIMKNHYRGKKYIINIGSIASSLYSNQSPAYHVAKGGLVSLTKYLAVAAPGYKSGTTVNCLELGFVVQQKNLKKFFSKKNTKYKNLALKHLPNSEIGREADVASFVNFLISGQADFVNGAIIPLEGGSTLKEQFTFSFQLNEQFNSE